MTDEVLLIGVDGGGTNTRVALASTKRGLLGLAHAGSGNYHDVGIEAVGRHVAAARDAAFAAAKIDVTPVATAFLGMASVASATDRDTVRTMARDVGLASEKIDVDTDLRIALMGGLAGRPGIALIAGTGSSCYGRTTDGRDWQAGGFGSFLDDGGSASDFGRRAMIACVRVHDGRERRRTVIAERVLSRLGLNDVRDLLFLVDGEGMPRGEIAKLARIVTEAAGEGDIVASAILRRGADDLALCVATVARKLGFDRQPLDSGKHGSGAHGVSEDETANVEVACTGGLCASATPYRAVLDDAIRRRVPHANPVDPALPSVFGAVLCAAELADRSTTNLIALLADQKRTAS